MTLSHNLTSVNERKELCDSIFVTKEISVWKILLTRSVAQRLKISTILIFVLGSVEFDTEMSNNERRGFHKNREFRIDLSQRFVRWNEILLGFPGTFSNFHRLKFFRLKFPKVRFVNNQTNLWRCETKRIVRSFLHFRQIFTLMKRQRSLCLRLELVSLCFPSSLGSSRTNSNHYFDKTPKLHNEQ